MTTAPESKTVFQIAGHRRRASLSLAPLIDVTFILLTFFMLVSQFSQLAPVEIALNAAPDAARQQTDSPLSARLYLHADGSFHLNDDANGRPKLEDAVPALRAFFANQSAQADAPPLVLLHPEADVNLQQMIDALTALQARPDFTVSLVIPATAWQEAAP